VLLPGGAQIRRRRVGDGPNGARGARSLRQAVPAAQARTRDVRMKALVTGAAGFIGSHLPSALLHRGATGGGLDCFTDYYARSIKETNLAENTSREGFRFVEGSIADADLSTLLEDVTHVFHLAAQAGVRKSWGTDFKVYTVNNVDATQILLEACV